MGLLETVLTEYGPWTWWVLGLVLLVVEVFHPYSIVIWFGLGALGVGVLSLFVGWPWQTLFLVWAVVSILLLVAFRRYFRRYAAATADPLLNDRAGRLVGRVYTLAEPIGENGGRLSIDDTVWRIRGPLAPVGARVRIVAVEGTVLVVAPEA